jgi:hypothetical protein
MYDLCTFDTCLKVGVHSAKFDAEKGSTSVAAAVKRHGIMHPVVNDSTCAMWDDLSIVCWPTLLLLSELQQNSLVIF